MNKIPPVIIETASVKVMRSHDYCHFEICLSSSFDINSVDYIQRVDALRKEAARLADKAVEQYKIAKAHMARRDGLKSSYEAGEADRIRAKPDGERIPEEMAALKTFDDALNRNYDYQDDWNDDDEASR